MKKRNKKKRKKKKNQKQVNHCQFHLVGLGVGAATVLVVGNADEVKTVGVEGEEESSLEEQLIAIGTTIKKKIKNLK